MDKELDIKLCELAPTLFGDRYKSMRQTALCWGFECGNGWREILREAAVQLEPLCRAELDKCESKEKVWYKYIRKVIGYIRPTSVANLAYEFVEKVNPDIYGNALYWYGGAPCRASQIKEKFGTLRFYMTSETDEMSAIIDKLESQSSKTCEECGKPGKTRGRGWLYTRCAACWKRMAK